MLRNLSTGTEASATGESLNSGDVAVHPAARHSLLDEIRGRLESVAVHSPCDADDSLPSVDVIRAAQGKAVADLGDNLRSFPTFCQVTLADDDLFRVRVGNGDVLWIPCGVKALQVRLMVCVHMRSAGHRGVSPTLFRLEEYCVCLLYTSPSPRDRQKSRMPSSA